MALNLCEVAISGPEEEVAGMVFWENLGVEKVGNHVLDCQITQSKSKHVFSLIAVNISFHHLTI